LEEMKEGEEEKGRQEVVGSGLTCTLSLFPLYPLTWQVPDE
jgi:hypothetical protein